MLELHGGGGLVDLLPARAAAAEEGFGEGVFGDGGAGGEGGAGFAEGVGGRG